jgi:hypothetical protein
MSLEGLVSKYIASAERVFCEMEVVGDTLSLNVDSVRKVLDFARAYLEDAKYYRDKKKFEVSLASVAYCEGLLDALKLLGAVKFEWSTREMERSGK